MKYLNNNLKGNAQYQKKSNESAILSYTRAIQFSKTGSEEMSLALANRY